MLYWRKGVNLIECLHNKRLDLSLEDESKTLQKRQSKKIFNVS